MLYSDATSLLVDILLAVDEEEREDGIVRLLDAIHKQHCEFSMNTVSCASLF